MGKAPDEEILTKGEFAQLCKVSASRLSQWIAKGKISAAALVGEGRSAKIRVLRAQADLKRNLDPNQMTANGVRTRIPGGPLQPEPPPLPDPPPSRRQAAEPEIPVADLPATDLLDLPTERALLTREQRLNWEMRNRERAGELIDHAEAERRWTEEIVDLRTRTLAVAGSELPRELPHLSADDIAVIDRVYRRAMHRAAGGDA